MDSDAFSSSSSPIRSIVIVGGGTAGWMAATYLARRLAHLRLSITVIESSAIGTVGVGEATVPAIRDFFAAIELGEPEVLRETEGTIKYGIRFAGWQRPDHAFFHPFGLYGMPARGVAFHQYWLKMRAAGDTTPLDRFSLCTQLAERGLFLPPTDRPQNDLGVFDFAVHFDASKFAALLGRLARANGVAHVDARIDHVHRHGGDGRIEGVTLADGRRIDGDLWIDCSGFRSLLLGEALGVPYVDWRHWLPCDRAVAIPCAAAVDAHRPLTTATARSAGWQWHIPLRHRIGNGHVYCSDFIDDAAAEDVLVAHIEGAPLAAPNRLRFTTGHRARFWENNVVGLGLSSGFLEPLESTSITLIQSGLERLVALFPDRAMDPRLAATYNRQSVLEFERIRDFLFLHYWSNRREGEPFWDHMRGLAPPETLQVKVDAWRAGGEFVRNEWDTFQDPSWLSMYTGFEDLPVRHSPLADQFTTAELADTFARMQAAIAATLAHAEPHVRFLDRLRPA
ncbi:tryptophan halogenase family protein [Sphingomonas sp. CFBP 8760]|uniref:tryptophan halogenase family protein n=1 Tax=Sphingomonas sp. CFBP 8760 TaxID=2775282 RepID=UPI0017802E8C|nr:tryptophan halogenase family protein [Sphingomonas sp. CFBP 8760]MBD8547121.1 tryptophan 7-halogenase [Sphingomonas sp. CFBP 8760]